VTLYDRYFIKKSLFLKKLQLNDSDII